MHRSGKGLNYKYTLKVWLTSISLGSTIFFLYKLVSNLSLNEAAGLNVGSAITSYLFTIVLAIILSAPAVILFALFYHLTTRFIFSSFRIKCMMVLIAEMLCWLSFLITYGFDNTEAVTLNLYVILPYSISTFISVFVFKLYQDD